MNCRQTGQRKKDMNIEQVDSESEDGKWLRLARWNVQMSLQGNGCK